MKITIEATPEEITKLLQVVGSNLEQQLSKIIHDPSNSYAKTIAAKVHEENNKTLSGPNTRIGRAELGI
ncbi:hypothetical protein [Enterococcus thailandicus]|uniref:hypothetical protein n=1 Tax=Enterococcus TaxID=1350 RepID=UPI0022DF1EC5|nr:hypothetical protein [Enterococcus thailandicus]